MLSFKLPHGFKGGDTASSTTGRSAKGRGQQQELKIIDEINATLASSSKTPMKVFAVFNDLPTRFDARTKCWGRTYHYLLPESFLVGGMTSASSTTGKSKGGGGKDSPVVASLTRIAKMFEGVHDFSNFSTQKKKKSLSQDIKETTTKEGEDEEDDEGEEDDDEEENEEANDGEEKRSKEQRKAKEVISTNRAGGEGKEIRIINKFECKGEVDVKGIKMYCMEGILVPPLSL